MPDFHDHSTAVLIGASGGIGLALTERLLTDPRFERVIAGCRSPGAAAELQRLASEHPALELVSIDATRPETISALGETLKSRGIRPSLVIYCAGLLHRGDAIQPEKRLEDIEAAALNEVFAVNAFGPALVFKTLLPLMARQQPSVMAAISARVGSIEDNRLGGWYAYRASKAALNQIMRTASIEARRRFKSCVLVCLHPGTTDTGLSKPFQANVPEGKLFSTSFVAEHLLDIIEGLNIEDSGSFLAWDGKAIPW
jgi:NAD(P)-dependent dehydrogenase (short-subunit alcohol dehydrogenase family)